MSTLDPNTQSLVEEIAEQVATAAVHKVINRLNLDKIASDAATQAIHGVLTEFGFDVRDPTEVQKDIAHLRLWRRTVDGMTRKMMASVLWLAVAGLAALVVLGLQSWLESHNLWVF